MVKKIAIIALAFVIVAAVAFTGCTPARRPYSNYQDNRVTDGFQGNRTDYAGNSNDNRVIGYGTTGYGTTGYGNTGYGNTGYGNNYYGTGNRTGYGNGMGTNAGNNAMSRRIETAVRQIEGVQNATAVVSGNTVYVGVSLVGATGNRTGYTGTTSNNGYTGANGRTANTDTIGYTGNAGTTIGGTAGTTGYGKTGFGTGTGNTGFGTNGYGTARDYGYNGNVGATGNAGNVGFAGNSGTTGNTGYTNNTGMNRNVSYTGNTGMTGNAGYTGTTANATNIERRVSQIVKALDTNITTVYVSTDNNFSNRLRTMNQGTTGGTGFTNGLRDLVRGMTPVR